MKPKIPYPDLPIKGHQDAQASAIVARVERITHEAKKVLDSEPPVSRNVPDHKSSLLAEAMASNAEISLLLFQRLGQMDEQIRQLSRWRERQESLEHRATEVLINERKSKFQLEEEVTRADLHLKKIRNEKLWAIGVKILAVIMTPPGAWGLWKWLTEHLPSIIKGP